MGRSQWSRGLRRRSAAARLLRSCVRIPPGAWIFVCCECCVLSGRGFCDELMTRPEESYRLCCVVMCDQETSRMGRPWPTLGRSATEKKKLMPCSTGIKVKRGGLWKITDDKERALESTYVTRVLTKRSTHPWVCNWYIDNSNTRTRIVFSPLFLFLHLTSPFRVVSLIATKEYFLPLLPCCVRESADGSGAMSDVFTDTLLCFCFLLFLQLAWRPGKDQYWINTSHLFNERTAVEVVASPTQTFTSAFSWDMWYLLGVLLDSTSVIFLTLGVSRGQSSEREQQARFHTKRLVFLRPIISAIGLLLMTGSDCGCRGIDHSPSFNVHHSILAFRQFNKLVLMTLPTNDLELLPPFRARTFE